MRQRLKTVKIEIPKAELFRIYKEKAKYNNFYYRFKRWFREAYNCDVTKFRDTIHNNYLLEAGFHNGSTIADKEMFFFFKYMNLFPEIDHQDVCFHLAGYKSKKEKARDKKKEERKKRRFDYNDVTNSFYKTHEWITISKKVKEFYGRKCMRCYTEKGQMHTDHIKPRSLYPSLEFDIDNLQVLCKICNNEKSNKEEIDYRTEEQIRKCNRYLSRKTLNF